MVEEEIRGINEEYDMSQKALAQHKLKLAKEKMLTGNISSHGFIFMCDLKTQKGMKLRLNFSNIGINYYIESKIISWSRRYNTIVYTDASVIYGIDFEDFNNTLKEHKQCCCKNVKARFNKLKIGYYCYESWYFLTGVVDNSIVFLYRLFDLSDFSMNMYIDENNYINVLLDSCFGFRIDVSDYSIIV